MAWTEKGSYSWYEIQDVVGYFEEFLKPKIIWGNLQSSPSFVFDKSSYTINAPACILPTDDLYLLALMNSNVSWYFWKNTAIARNGGYLELKPQYVEPLPIPSATDSQKQALVTLAEACQTAAEARFKLQQDVRRRIPDLCPPEREAKLNNKLKEWWTLPDFDAFQREIKKAFKGEVPLKDRNDWEDWLATDRAKINQLTAEIEANEAKINALVYELFALTDDEIELLEANI